MTPPKNPTELADEIERLVASYLEEVRRSVRQSVEIALAKPPGTDSGARRTVARPKSGARSAKRRTTEELSAVRENLLEAVRVHPGDSMMALSKVVGVAARELNRPMTQLKTAGLVRSVGERNLARYFPMVAALVGAES